MAAMEPHLASQVLASLVPEEAVVEAVLMLLVLVQAVQAVVEMVGQVAALPELLELLIPVGVVVVRQVAQIITVRQAVLA